MKVAFHPMGGDTWPVGPVYFGNLFRAVRRTYGDQVEFLLQVPTSEPAAHDYARLVQADRVILFDPVRPRTFKWIVNGAIHRIFSRDWALAGSLRKNQIDVLFAPAIAYRYSRVGTLVWLPDFQHLHLPDNFSTSERHGRDRSFLRSCQFATRIVLMSEAVKKDVEAFAPQYAHKARVLRPVSDIPASIYETDLTAIQARYSLPAKFVYLPGQFWKHKNHERVFSALRLLKARGVRVVLVCTGHTDDYRHPGYFAELRDKLTLWGIDNQVIYLGVIPHEHVLLLMRMSVCVMNASLFEGWGYTAEEARSVGKRLLLSDIPTHREQNPPGAAFFAPQTVEDLASQLELVWDTASPGPDLELERSARRELEGRLRGCADTFMTIALEAMKEARG